MRAFIFSLDAFVAFTLALVAIYSLIFFSSVPSSYYYLLTQGHYLSRDVLMALSTTVCSDDYTCINSQGTLLENIVSHHDPDLRDNLIQNTVGLMVPNQFGYSVWVSKDLGDSWELLYDTAELSDPHAKQKKKLSISSQAIVFEYTGDMKKLVASPYNYLGCGWHAYGYDAQQAEEAGFVDLGLITCGESEFAGGGGEAIATGNTHPSNVLGDELVPSSNTAILKLTVYI